MRNAKRWLAAMMSAAMVFSGAGVTTLSSVAVYAESYDYTVTGLTIPDQPFTDELPDLNSVDELATITVDGGLVLERGVDFEVEADSSKVGTANAIFTGIGDYAGKTIAPVSFQIVEAVDDNEYTAEIDAAKFVYDGDELTEDEVADATDVIMNGNVRVDYPDYDIVINADSANKTNAGNAGEKYEITIKIPGATEDQDITVTTQNIEIGKLDLAQAVSVIGNTSETYTYDSKAKEAKFDSVDAEFENGVAENIPAKDFAVSGYENNINATKADSKASATITAAAACQNFTGSAKVEFEIAPVELSGDIIKNVTPASVEYNGEVQKPEISAKVVFADEYGAADVPAADYKFAYVTEDSKDVGVYEVTIEPSETGNIVVGDVTPVKAYDITQASLKNVTAARTDKVIPTGKDVSESMKDYFEIKSGNYTLEQGKDYTAAKPTANGTSASVKITGTGNFKDDYTISYTTEDAVLADTYTSAVSGLVYDGTAKRPAASTLGTLTIKDQKADGVVSLASGDYTVTDWANNINATSEKSMATATIEGKGKYEGQTATVEFAIQPKEIGTVTVANIAEGAYYVGAEIKGATVTTADKKNLTADDCKVTAKEIADGYLTKVTVEGKGNYTGTFDADVKVASNVASLNNAEVSGTVPAGLKNYDEEMIKKFITVSIDGREIADDTYTLVPTLPKDGVKVGSEISVKLTPAKEVISGAKTASLKVEQRDIADLKDAVSLEKESYVYSGEKNEPKAEVAATEDTNALVLDTDYTVAWANNVDAGTATATISGKGNYTGSVTKEFKIEKYELTAKDFVLVEPAATARQFKVGPVEDHSADLTIKAAAADSKLQFSAADYTIKLKDSKQEVKATDKATDVFVEYVVTINKDSKNYKENKQGFDGIGYNLVAKTVKNAEISFEKDQLAYVSDDVEDYDAAKLGKSTVKVDGTELTAGTDYVCTLKGTSGKVGSELTVEVSFQGNYVGIDTKTKVTVVANVVDLSNIKLIVPTAANCVYSGEPIVPEVSDIGKEKVDEDAYVIVYKDADGKELEDEPVDAGTYTATVKATEENGGAEGESVTYTITPEKITAKKLAELAEDIFVGSYYSENMEEAEGVYYAGEKTEQPKLFGENADQFEVVSYDKEWDGKAETGKAVIALKEGANYVCDETLEKEFTWEAMYIYLIADEAYTISDQTYNGKSLEPEIEVAEGYDVSADWVTVESWENNTDVGNKKAKANVRITVPEDEKKYAGETYMTIIFNILPADISDADITIDKTTYNGKAQTPDVVVKDADGAVLTKDKDYSVTYSENTKPAKGTATIKGIKNYTGEAEADFRIQFKDVTNEKQFYYDYVYWAADEGITTGNADGTFAPNKDCNRASVVTFLWRLAGKPEASKKATFKDMTGNADFDAAISWASEKGIVTGWTEDNTFRPWVTCNRAAIATFIWRYAGKPAASKTASFSDMTKKSDFDSAISWAAEKGIVTGYDNGKTFKPWDKCKRLAVVTFLGRYAEL